MQANFEVGRFPPPSKLGGFRSTQMDRHLRVESQRGADSSRTCRRHEAGPVQTKAPHDEPGQGVELNAGLAGLEADDGLGRDASRRRERLQADSLALAFLAQASSDAGGDGPHRVPRTGATGAERSLVGGRTNDDMMGFRRGRRAVPISYSDPQPRRQVSACCVVRSVCG